MSEACIIVLESLLRSEYQGTTDHLPTRKQHRRVLVGPAVCATGRSASMALSSVGAHSKVSPAGLDVQVLESLAHA